MLRHIKISRALFFCATALPPGLIAALIFKYGVDFPFEDQWAFAPLFLKFAEGTLTFGDLFAQQNEYRQFFPNLVIIGLGWLTRWDVRYEMAFSFVLASLVSFNVYRLGRLTLQGVGGGRRWQLAFLLSHLLIFSPAQYLNWLMGEQLVYFFPIACVTTCLVVAYSGLGFRAKFALCACLSAVSTFSSANGIFCWVVVYPALAWAGARDVSRGTRLRLATVWGLGLALSAALYLYGYQSPPHHPSITSAFAHPVRAATHFLGLLGSTLAGENVSMVYVAVGVGVVLLTLYAASALRLLRAGTAHPSSRTAIGWLMLGAYSILSAALVSLARSGFGVAQSTTSRYTTFTLYLLVSLIYLLALQGVDDGSRARARKLSLARLVPAGVVLLLCLHAVASFIALQQMGLLRTRLLQAKACHMFIQALPDPECLRRNSLPGLAEFRPVSQRLEALGFWRPGLVKSNRLEEFAARAAPAPGDYASFDVLVREGESYRASGRALLPNRREPPDAVLLAYEADGGTHVAFAQAELNNQGYFFLRFWRQWQNVEWQKSFDASELPQGASNVTAWAFDAESGMAFRLDGAHDLRGF